MSRVTRHRGTSRRSIPTVPRSAARSPAPRASSTTSPSPPATSTGSCSGTSTCSASAFMARTVLDEAPISVFSVLTTNEKSHDLGVVLDGSTAPGASTTTRSGSTPAKSCSSPPTPSWRTAPDRVRAVDPRHRRADVPLLPRAVEPAHRAEHRRVPQLRAGLGGEHLEAVAGLEQLLPQQRDADVDDGVLPAADGPSATEEGVPDEIKDALLNPYAKHGQG